MIVSATAKVAAKAVANASPSSSVKGTTGFPSSDEQMAWVEGVGHVGLCIISGGTAHRKTLAGRGTNRKQESLLARRPITSDASMMMMKTYLYRAGPRSFQL